MKKFRRFVSSFLVLCMLMAMLPVSVFAETAKIASGTCGDNLTWVLNSDGALTISGVGQMEDYTSSSTVPWYKNQGSITSVIIEESVTSIGSYAFDGCESLFSVDIPKSITSIGDCAFYNCWGLQGVEIPSNVTSIGDYAFYNCSGLQSITIPENITSLGKGAFYDCAGLTEINFNATAMDDLEQYNEVFKDVGWSEVTVTIGENVTKIPAHLFNPYNASSEAPNITTVVFSEDSRCTSIGENAFASCDKLKSVIMPKGLTNIETGAFACCYSLTNISIPDSVTTIGAKAFSSCDSLTSVTIPKGVATISDHAFYSCDKLKSVIMPKGLTNIGSGAFSGCYSLTNISIPDSVTTIGVAAFFNCGSLTSVTIPKGVATIGDNAFRFCDSLSNVTIPNSVTTIGNGTFYDCSSLTDIMIPDSVTYIGDAAFEGCSSLTSITIPDSVTSIGDGVFGYCDKLISVTILDGVTTIGGYTFKYCSNLDSVTIPNSVTTIGIGAFSACSGLSDVYYGGFETEWLATDIGEGNECLTNATIHYNSSGPENGSGENGPGANVRYFTGWDAEKQIAYFDGDTIIGSQVTNETDTSFLDNVDSLVGQYVLVQTRPREDSMIASDTLISIKSVETKTGTVTDVDTGAKTVTIDGVTYNVTMSRVLEGTDGNGQTELVDLSAYVDEFVLYHIYDGKIVGIEALQTTKGMLTYWDAETRKITITHDDRTTTTYTLSELADADTIALLGETGYFEFDVAYVTDGNSFLYQITRAPVIDFADGYVLRAYFDRRELTVQCHEEMEFVCALYYDGLPQEDWSKPVFTTSNENVLSVTACEKTDSGYCLKVKGGQPGTATITVTDADSGAYVDFNVEVREAGVLPYSYLIDEVPSFYPDVWGDKDTQTNFYNVNGLYVNGFPEEVYKFDGKYRLSFTVYNSTNMYGSVDVYDENGNWYSSRRIDKHTSITGLWDTAKGAFFLLYDGMEDNFFSYTANSCSTPTEIDIEVPEGGYFTISNNFVESPGTYIYNSVDFMMIGIDMLTDLAFSSTDIKGVQEQTVNQILQTPDAYETFLVSFKDIAQEMVKDVTKQGYGDAVEAFTLSAFGLFDDMQFDFIGVVELACNSAGNVAEGVFEKCTPPVIGGTLKGMFAINKYLDRLHQVKDVYNSEDKPYIRLYTPEATGGLTISGVTVVPTEGALPDNAVLQVFRIANTEALIISDEGLVANQYELYNIGFTVNNVETQPNGTVTVKIPVPANYNSEKCIVLHQQEDGNWRTVESKIEQGFIVFEVDHFCQFAVVDTSITTEEYTPGDINGDGAVNNKDLTRLFQYLSGYDAEIEQSALDVNGDGSVNNKDLTRLFQFLSGWDVEIN